MRGEMGRRYATDLTDEEWAILGPLLARPAGGPGRPRRVDLRAVVDALRYQGRTGCQWRLLPDGFPSWGTVRSDFDRWTWDGTLARLNDAARPPGPPAGGPRPGAERGRAGQPDREDDRGGRRARLRRGEKGSPGASATSWWTRSGC